MPVRRKISGKSGWADHYTDRAKKEGFPARSVYKLSEMQEKWRFLKPGQRVLDLGCAPGSWLLYAAKIVGPKGKVVGVDKTPVALEKSGPAVALEGDVLDLEGAWVREAGGAFDVVLSDMAPATTGNKATDTARSMALAEAALAVADRVLSPGGYFVCKVFEGADLPGFVESVKARFDRHKRFVPQSSRKASKEIFIIGMGKKGRSDVRS